jgi:hypothetical protein
MMFLPIIALIVATSLATGGIDAVVLTLDSTIRDIVAAIVNFVRSL